MNIIFLATVIAKILIKAVFAIFTNHLIFNFPGELFIIPLIFSIAAGGVFNELPAWNNDSYRYSIIIEKMKIRNLDWIYSTAQTDSDSYLQPIVFLPSHR